MEKSKQKQQDSNNQNIKGYLIEQEQQQQTNLRRPKLNEMQSRGKDQFKNKNQSNNDLELPGTSQSNYKFNKKRLNKDQQSRGEQVDNLQNQQISTEQNKIQNKYQKPQLLIKNLQKKHQNQQPNDNNQDTSKNQQEQQQITMQQEIENLNPQLDNMQIQNQDKLEEYKEIVKTEDKSRIEDQINSNNNINDLNQLEGNQQVNNLASSKIILDNNSSLQQGNSQQQNIRGRFMREHMQDFIVKQNEQKKQMREILEQQIQEKKRRQQEERQKEIERETREEQRIKKEITQIKQKDDQEKNKEQKRLNTKPSLPALQKIDFNGKDLNAGSVLESDKHQLQKVQSSKDMIWLNQNQELNDINQNNSKIVMSQSVIQKDMKFNNLISTPSSTQFDLNQHNNANINNNNNYLIQKQQKIIQLASQGGEKPSFANLLQQQQQLQQQQHEVSSIVQEQFEDFSNQRQDETKVDELVKENQKLQDQLSKNEALIEMLIGSWKENHRSDNVRKEALKQLAYRGFSLGNDLTIIKQPHNIANLNQITPTRNGNQAAANNTNNKNNNKKSRNIATNINSINQKVINNNINEIGAGLTTANSENQRNIVPPLKLNINNQNEYISEQQQQSKHQPPKTSQESGITQNNKLKHLSMIPANQYNSNYVQSNNHNTINQMLIPRILKSSTPYKSLKNNNGLVSNSQIDQINQLNIAEFETPQEVFMMEKKIQNQDTIHNLQPLISNNNINNYNYNIGNINQQQQQQQQLVGGINLIDGVVNQNQLANYLHNNNASSISNINNLNNLGNNNLNQQQQQKELFSNAFEYYTPNNQTGMSNNFKNNKQINSNQQTPISSIYNNNDLFFPSPNSFYSSHINSILDNNNNIQQQQQKQQFYSIQGSNQSGMINNLSPLNLNQRNGNINNGIPQSASSTNLKCIALKNFKLPQEFMGTNLNKKFFA